MPSSDDETYVATAPLYIYTEGAGVMPQLAYRAGATITADVLAANPAWRGRVRRRERPPGAAVVAAPKPARGKTAACPPSTGA